ncbi:hypothetical protein [Aquimarina sp. 2201CG5-10]|uniref:hypothetical protein n=1 Tax=Aquimarina callyspongiae TaxID=3098150 RepID=UPI002AB5C121|nr:hypothetical protein [Aquimarina sp. 2201CG5-10]MDY8138598.1 hypothetical protein [Aquimarina sp. 2201CG5-10]
MNTSIKKSKLVVIISILFLTTQILTAQVTYQDELETVYLNDQSEEVVYENNFSNFNEKLISLNEINFKLEIQKAKLDNSYLRFLSERSTLELYTVIYLKTIRKGANRSRNAEDFEIYMMDKLPELMYQFSKDKNLKELYIISRKDTFNGKIDALPGVL